MYKGPLGVFEHPFFCKIEKNKQGPFGDIKKICEKISRSRNNLHKKIGQGLDSNPRPSAWHTSKKPNSPLCRAPVEVVWHSLVLVQVS